MGTAQAFALGAAFLTTRGMPPLPPHNRLWSDSGRPTFHCIQRLSPTTQEANSTQIRSRQKLPAHEVSDEQLSLARRCLYTVLPVKLLTAPFFLYEFPSHSDPCTWLSSMPQMVLYPLEPLPTQLPLFRMLLISACANIRSARCLLPGAFPHFSDCHQTGFLPSLSPHSSGLAPPALSSLSWHLLP